MVRATDHAVGERTATLRQPPPTVQARVVERVYFSVRAAHDGDRFVADRVLDEVARLGDLLGAARDLPHTGPQAVELESSEGAGRIALLGNEAVGADPHEIQITFTHDRIGL